MSNLLRVTCPKCSTKLQVQRPNAARATVRCTCGHAFTFTVPTASAPATPAAPAAPAPSPAAGDDLFSNLPASPPAGMNAPAPALQSRVTPRKPKKMKSGKKRGGGSPTWVGPVIGGGVGLAFMIGIGVALWMLLGNGTLGLFDSADAIVAEANERDLEVQRFVNELEVGPLSDEQRDTFIEKMYSTQTLFARAILLSPLSKEESESIKDSPLTDEERDAMLDKIVEFPEQDRGTMIGLVSSSLNGSRMLREYLRGGHVELPEPTSEGERLAAERINLLRELNRLGAKAVKGVPMDAGKDLKETPEIKEFIDGIYGSIEDDVLDVADKMYDLAAERYRLSSDEIGNPSRYNEILLLTRHANVNVFIHRMALSQSGASIAKPLGEFSQATQEYESAGRGFRPSRVPADEPAPDIAASSQQGADQLQDNMMTTMNDMPSLPERPSQIVPRRTPGGPSTQDFASGGEDPSSVGEPYLGPGGRFGPRGGFDPSSRFGPRGPGGPGSRGTPGPGFGGEMPNRDRSRAPAAPPGPIDTTKGVTITMANASGVETRDVSALFQPLKVRIHSRKTNNRLTTELAYTGPLEEIVKLIDFGKVTSIDEQTRTIVVEPN